MSALFVLVMTAMFVVAPILFPSQAVVDNSTAFSLSKKQTEGLPNYDIRIDENAVDTLVRFRGAAGKSAVTINAAQQKFEQAEAVLRQRVSSLVVEYNQDLRVPEVIAPDSRKENAFLTTPAAGKNSSILRSFVKSNNELVGLTDRQVDDLRLTAEYTNPDGKLSYAHFEQFINGVPVFRGEIKAGFGGGGEIVRIINNLAPALDYETVSADFGSAENSARAAFAHVKRDAGDLQISKSDDLKIEFNGGDASAEKMYFPLEAGVARAAWRILIWGSEASYYVIVDAETGTMLWRKNITSHQTQAATYSVYSNSANMIKSADSPAPLLPAPLSPFLGAQGALTSRTNITLIGNEGVYSFNNLGWITDGSNATEGNNVIGGLDRAAPNGVDAPVAGTNRTFNFTYNPAPGNPVPGEEPLPAGQSTTGCSTTPVTLSDFQKGAATHLFYVSNRYHDETYLLGFTEPARNFQQDNFGRGGLGADRVLAEGQDCGGTNNANFSTAADGGSGRMQMYLFTGPAPDRDGTLDTGVITHELTHGLSNRLHGNAAGLTTNMAGGMGEGWSDFFAHSMLSEPTHPIDGIYTVGGYATLQLATQGTTNYYYGIRRFPKVLISAVGPNGKPHNPLTFRHLNSNCNDEIGTPTSIGTISAYPRGVVGAATCDQVHNAGEIWSSALWEVRANFVQRLGWANGNPKTLQYVIDGMKLSPLNPTFLQARDAIISAARASGGTTDANDVWAGFARRGIGFSARINTANSPASVIEAFDIANLQQTPTFSVSDASGNNNGFPEPGEQITLTIPLTNPLNEAASNVQLQIGGGGTGDYGTIAALQTASRTISYTVPANTPCGSILTLTFNVTSSLGPVTLTKSIVIGAPVVTLNENFDGVNAPALPAGWSSGVTDGGTGWTTSTAAPDSAPNAATATAPGVGGSSELISPAIPVSSQAAILTFRHSYNLQTSFDGATLEIKIGADAFRNIETAGGSFLENGFNIVLQGTGNPLAGQRGWNGNSNGLVTTSVRLPASAAGQNVQFRFRLGHNQSITSPGWTIDTIRVSGDYTCSPIMPVRSSADFDGDGKTDLSVFRPAEGNWYLNRATAGFSVINWGVSSDTLVTGDYDGDGKADAAIFRPSNAAGVADFYILNSENNSYTPIEWGSIGDVPVAGDYTGDGKTDAAVFRPSNGTWYVLPSGGGSPIIVNFGLNGDKPVAGDYDADGKTDFAVFRPSERVWYIQSSTAGFTAVQFGLSADKLVPADYDNDNKTDVAVFRDGVWYILRSTNGQVQYINFGIASDTPTPGDYDGDGADDAAIYRGGVWYVLRSTAGLLIQNFGISTDNPVPARQIN